MVSVAHESSERNVTILSIFAGIVLTVVAGLIYSSSLLNNIQESNFYRLVSLAALVGLVCYNLIGIMYLFIERRIPRKESIFSKLTIGVSATLLIITILFACLQGYCDVNDRDQSEHNSDNETNYINSEMTTESTSSVVDQETNLMTP